MIKDSGKKKSQVATRSILRNAYTIAGLRHYLQETGRNAIVHGHAENVTITFGRHPIRSSEIYLEMRDDGVGMSAEDRWRAGEFLGESAQGSGGVGFRYAAVTIAQRLEMQTIHRDDPDTVWSITMPLVQFFLETHAGDWNGKWEKIPRTSSRFPKEQVSGTIVLLSDFRAADSDDPLDQSKFRSTGDNVTEEAITRYMHMVFPPDHVRRFHVCGKRLVPRPLEGFRLLREAVSTKSGLGDTSCEIRLSPVGSGNWLQISGLASAIVFSTFAQQFADHNSELAKRIPRVFFRERRLAGFIRISALEKFPTPDRAQLLAAFYSSPEAVMVVDELVRIADKLEESLRRYENQPRTEQTESSIAEIITQLHTAQGVSPGSALGGERPGTAGTAPVPATPPPEPLRVSPATLHLEPWSGKGERDAVTVLVQNALPGEQFDWEDPATAGILTDVHGERATIQAVSREGVYLVMVRSRQHPERTQTIRANIRHREPTVRPSDDQFSLAPLSTQIYVGHERAIRIRTQGRSSGEYEWKVEPSMKGKTKLITLEVQPGAREVRILGLKPEKFIITCMDKRDPKLVAVSKIEVLAVRPDDDAPPAPPPSGKGSVPGADVVQGGTGDPANPRPSPQDGKVLLYEYLGRWFEFVLRSDPIMRDPFSIEPEGKRILISDAAMPSDEDPNMRQLHVAWCVASGISLLLSDAGVLDAGDHVGIAQLQGDVLAKGLRKPEKST